MADLLDVGDALEEIPTPIAPTLPWWFWSVVLLGVSSMCAFFWLVEPRDPLKYWLIPYTAVGNSLLLVPYDWYLPAYVQHHAALMGVTVATAATMLVEFWNMDVLARILSRDGTRAFRGHRITGRFLVWYRKAPWWTMVAAGALPVIPFYPCRLLATLSRYPMWRYQSSVAVGRAARYLGLAGVGLLLPIPPAVYFIVGLGMLVAVGAKHLHSRMRTRRVTV